MQSQQNSIAVPHTGNTKSIYVTFTNWYPSSTIKEIIVEQISGTTISNEIAISITNWNIPSSNVTYLAHTTSENLTGEGTVFKFNDLDISSVDYFDSNFLQIGIHKYEGGAYLPIDSEYTVTVIGNKNLDDTLSNVDFTSSQLDNSLRIIAWNNSVGKMIDLTNKLEGKSCVDITIDENLQTPDIITDENDFLYIGSELKNSALSLIIPTDNTQPLSASGSIEYLSASGTWEDMTDLININSTYGINNYFQYSGILGFTSDAFDNALKTQLTTDYANANDPLYDMIENIKAGNAPPIGFTYNPNRYWVRIHITGGSYPFRINSISNLRK
jgi:hypothetical protein